ncbi:MAG: alpha/beta hydrolase-fold protein [Ginsengibacter sp.]
MKHLLSLLLVLSFSLSYGQTDDKIVIGTIDSINSSILHEKRKIWIHVPESYNAGIYAPQRYPVVYLLDGDAHFFSVEGMIHQLSTVNENTVVPEMIVVGIPNTDRTRDLTPTHVDAAPPFLDSNASKTSGGGEKFISFIEKELMSHIDSLYPTEPYKILIGHSFGGLTVINTLINHPDMFNAYIAIDPSMWWDQRKLLKQSKSVLANHNYKGKALFLAIANTMSPGMNTTTVKKDTSAVTAHIRSILELNKYLKYYKKDGLNYKSKYYKDDNHGSVPLIAEYDVLHFIFSYYPLQLSFDDFMNMNASTVEKIKKHYEDISAHFGFKVPVPESFANQLAYQALGMKRFAAAKALFEMNIENYPQSFNAFDSMGDYYAATGDKAKAIDNYKKALSLKEFPETRKKLEDLEGK